MFQITKILKKIEVLNQATLDSMLEESYISIIKNFTEAGIEILDADFGFAWWKFKGSDKYKIIYKSIRTPQNLTFPKNQDNDLNLKKIREISFDGSKDTKNHINIPVHYGDHVFGNIIVCYKKSHNFTKEELVLSSLIGNIAAQATTIPWLVENEEQALVLSEKQKEVEILLAQEKLKTEFLTNAAHELRTPLAIMKGNVDLVLMDKGNAKGCISALKAVGTEITVLSEIIRDLALLTSSAQEIKHKIRDIPVDVENVIKKIIQRVKVIAAEKNISIQLKTKINSKLVIRGDEEYLEKLFLNLLANAISYGKKDGNVSVTISKNKNMIEVKVSDNGVGISKEDLPKIFERFYRTDKAHNNKAGNHSGLGLAIVKWVAEIHGGSVNAKSTHGKGSTFTVSLPILVRA